MAITRRQLAEKRAAEDARLRATRAAAPQDGIWAALHEYRSNHLRAGKHISELHPLVMKGLITIESAPEAHRERIGVAVVMAIDSGNAWPFSFLGRMTDGEKHYFSGQGKLCPAYPSAPTHLQARLACGYKPAEVYPGLTAAEAHQAATEGYPTAHSFLMREVTAGDHVFSNLHYVDVSICRWVWAAYRDDARRGALIREGRRGGGMLARLDEVRPEDLKTGAATGVQTVFDIIDRRADERRRQRVARQLAETGGKAAGEPPRWWRQFRYAKLLLTMEALNAEAEEMNNCVDTYYQDVCAGESVIISLAVPDEDGIVHRSTAEISRRSAWLLYPKSLDVVQHYGKNNSPPHPLCVKALTKYRSEWFKLLESVESDE